MGRTQDLEGDDDLSRDSSTGAPERSEGSRLDQEDTQWAAYDDSGLVRAS